MAGGAIHPGRISFSSAAVLSPLLRGDLIGLAEVSGRGERLMHILVDFALGGLYDLQPDYYNGDSSLLRNVTRGWSISPILKVHSGFPFTVLDGADANFDGKNTDRAQLAGNPSSGSCPNGVPVGSALCWFNTSAFAKNPTTGGAIDGDSPRNFMNQPSYRDVDLAIFLTFKYGQYFLLETLLALEDDAKKLPVQGQGRR